MKREIVILTRSLPFHSLGGMEIVAWDLSKELARSGHNVRIITTCIPDRAKEFEEDGVRIVSLQEAPSGRYSSAWWSASREYFENNCMDKTHAVLSVSAAAFALLSLKPKLHNVPFVMQAHGTSWGEIVSKWRSRRLKNILSSAKNLLWLPKDLLAYSKFDVVVGVGERVNQDLAKAPTKWILPADKRHKINNGIDRSIFHPDSARRRSIRASINLTEQTPIVISASRLHLQKGVQHGLRAFAELQKTYADAVYLVAGDGPERAALELLAHDLGIAKHVRFLGALSRPQLAEWLQTSDALIFQTEHIEGLPLNILEALACGLPAVISNHLNLFPSPELHLLPPRDPVAISNVLVKIIKSSRPEKISALPIQFNLDYSAQQYLAVIEKFYSNQGAA